MSLFMNSWKSFAGENQFKCISAIACKIKKYEEKLEKIDLHECVAKDFLKETWKNGKWKINNWKWKKG